ncbi:Protein mrp-like protein [Neochlamydia sp. EPS4]|nr:Protein mrp-like protein [Neochlamydia sp. EPS4]
MMPLPMFPATSKASANFVHAIIGIAAGKGGVGKSCVTVNLARALKDLGFKVGILDADIYGPSIRRMLPEDKMPEQCNERILPAICQGVKVISMAYFRREDEAAAIRAPIANTIVQQFIKNVDWGEIDFLLIDFPPGTGDIQLTLSQNAQLNAAILVTTPQEVALMDVRKAMDLFYQMKIPIIGVIENMSYYQISPNLKRVYPLGQGGGGRLAKEAGFSLLGQIPISSEISHSGDKGNSLFEEKTPDAQAISKIFINLAKKVMEQLVEIKKRETAEVEKFFQKDPATFTLQWSDGLMADFYLSDLQRRCPCAGCIEKSVENKVGDKKTNRDELRVSTIERVGHYALRIYFTSGCNQGIYTFSFLRQMAQEQNS